MIEIEIGIHRQTVIHRIEATETLNQKEETDILRRTEAIDTLRQIEVTEVIEATDTLLTVVVAPSKEAVNLEIEEPSTKAGAQKG